MELPPPKKKKEEKKKKKRIVFVYSAEFVWYHVTAWVLLFEWTFTETDLTPVQINEKFSPTLWTAMVCVNSSVESEPAFVNIQSLTI